MFDFITQFLCTVLLFAGLWFSGNKRLLGPFLAFIAEFFTTIVGFKHHAWSIIIIGVGLFVIQGRNFLKWRKEGVAWALLLGISLSGSFARGVLYDPQWFSFDYGVRQEAVRPTIDAVTPWLYYASFAGSRNLNASATLTLTWRKR